MLYTSSTGAASYDTANVLSVTSQVYVMQSALTLDRMKHGSNERTQALTYKADNELVNVL